MLDGVSFVFYALSFLLLRPRFFSAMFVRYLSVDLDGWHEMDSLVFSRELAFPVFLVDWDLYFIGVKQMV